MLSFPTRHQRVLAASSLLVALAAMAGAEAAPPSEPAAPEPALAIAPDDPGLAWGPCPDFMPAGCALAVLHGDPAKPNADVFFRVPGRSKIPRHWHHSAERMVLVSGELHVGYEGQPPLALRPGQFAYGPPRRVHEARCASTDPCVLFIAFEGPIDAFAVSPADAE